MEKTIASSLTNLQLEILKIFSREVSSSDLLEIKELLSQFFAKKLIESANESWERQNWDNSKVEELLNTHIRTKYK